MEFMDSKVTKERRNTQHIACKNIKIEGMYSNFQIGTDYLLKNRHIIISSSIDPKCVARTGCLALKCFF